MNLTDPENHSRDIDEGDFHHTWPCRCGGKGRLFGGFTTCEFGYAALIESLESDIERYKKKIVEYRERRDADS